MMDVKDQFIRDMEYICQTSFIPWDELKGKTILITGATGLIGYTLVHALLYANRQRHLNMQVLAVVRDLARAKERFSTVSGDSALSFVIGNVEHFPEINGPIDYIVHGASQTASKAFVDQPVETILTALKGTENLLELARNKAVSGMVYLSSMEVYGYPAKGHKVTEDEIGSLTPLDVRNSYPISKIQCESLCYAYAKEYGVPVMSARLTQTFGPGVNYKDGRVFAEFARCVVEKRDIVLKTKGETERCYLYTADAVTAILTILLKGEAGQAYNVANESTYCSIAEMAEEIARDGDIKVRFDIQDESKNGYLKTLFMDMDTSLLQRMQWHAGIDSVAMYRSVIQCLGC